MSNTTNPFSIFTGQRTQPRILSRSHGIIRPGLVESITVTPKIEVKMIDEFDNLVPGLIYQTTGGGTGKIAFIESNQNYLAAALVDADPTVAQFAYNPSALVPFDVIMNLKGLDGKVKASAILYGCQLSGNPLDMAPKEAAKRSIDFMFLNAVIFYGLGLAYTRARGTGVMTAPPAVPTTATNTTGGFLAAGNYYMMLTAVTAAGETLPSTEFNINVPSGTTTNDIVVSAPLCAGAITAYNLYVSNLSNGERFIGSGTSSSSSNPITVTTLPSYLAGQPPLQNTSDGIWAQAADQVFATGVANLILPAAVPANTGLQYALIKENGNIIATLDNPATDNSFQINASGTTITVDNTNTYNVYDIVTPYQP